MLLRLYVVFLIAFIMMHAPLRASESDLYQQALDLRDGKVSGLSKEDAAQRAEELFYQLAVEGNPKAMHNYALSQNAKGNYEEAYDWFSKAGLKGLDASQRNAERLVNKGKVKQPLYLVVGSRRSPTYYQGNLISVINDDKKVDLKHLNTFNGLATSMDLLDCELKNQKHIRGDARYFDFSKYTIQAVLLERLTTVPKSTKIESIEEALERSTENYLGRCIQNISPAMKSGAIMEIEWLPCATPLFNYDPALADSLVRKNPFHSFFNMNAMLQSAFVLGGAVDNLNAFSGDFHQAIVDMVERVGLLLLSYHQKGMGKSFEHLVSTLYWESNVIFEMGKQDKTHVCIDYDPAIQDGEKLKIAFKEMHCVNLPETVLSERVIMPTSSGKVLLPAYQGTFFTGQTFFNYVCEDIAADLNGLYVLEYLKTLENLEVLEFKKGINPHNNRKNVWMIKLRKR